MSDLPLVIRRRPQKAPTVFDHVVEFQSHCLDVTIYSQKAKQVVTIAWFVLKFSCCRCQMFNVLSYVCQRPLQRNGRKVLAHQLRDWLRARGLHWSCFCGLTAPPGVHLSCQIVHASSGRVLAFCHYEPSTCKFFSMWFPLSIAPQFHPF